MFKHGFDLLVLIST